MLNTLLLGAFAYDNSVIASLSGLRTIICNNNPSNFGVPSANKKQVAGDGVTGVPLQLWAQAYVSNLRAYFTNKKQENRLDRPCPYLATSH